MSRKPATDDRQLVLLSPYVTRTALALPKDTSFTDWENMGRALKLCGSALAWWVGDWVIQGEELFADKAIQVVEEVTGLDPGTISTRVSVCKAIEKERRRELSFEHHKEVYMFPVKQQERWLDKAVNGRMTRSELRGAIKDAGLKKARKTKQKKRQANTTVALYESLRSNMAATMLMVPSLVEICTSINESWEERMPDQRTLDLLEKTTDGLLEYLHKMQAGVLELMGLDPKAESEEEGEAA